MLLIFRSYKDVSNMRLLGGTNLKYSIKLARSMAVRSDANSNIKSFVFVDLETTGLPYEENNTTRITELCLIAVQTEHLNLGVFPRVQNKLNLCIDPRKVINPVASAITGLSNQLLQCQSNFNSAAFETIYSFLQTLQKPVCLVAHNGNKFDFPILRAEIAKMGAELPLDVLCVDSLVAFRDMCNDENRTESNNQIPIELQDGYDILLCSILEDFERKCESETQILTPEEVQKKNETTPKKNKSIVRVGKRSLGESSNQRTMTAPKRGKFG